MGQLICLLKNFPAKELDLDMSLDQSYDCELRHNKNNKNQTRKNLPVKELDLDTSLDQSCSCPAGAELWNMLYRKYLSSFYVSYSFFTNLLSNYAIRFKVHLHLVRCLDFRVSQNSIDLPHGCHGGVWRNSVITLQKYSSTHLIELASSLQLIFCDETILDLSWDTLSYITIVKWPLSATLWSFSVVIWPFSVVIWPFSIVIWPFSVNKGPF